MHQQIGGSADIGFCLYNKSVFRERL